MRSLPENALPDRVGHLVPLLHIVASSFDSGFDEPHRGKSAFGFALSADLYYRKKVTK
jgi:hypothetical protein